MIWSKFTEKHGISGSNRGQVLSALDTNLLDSTQGKDVTRSARKQFPGSSMGLQELQDKVKTYKQNVETTTCGDLKATLKTLQ